MNESITPFVYVVTRLITEGDEAGDEIFLTFSHGFEFARTWVQEEFGVTTPWVQKETLDTFYTGEPYTRAHAHTYHTRTEQGDVYVIMGFQCFTFDTGDKEDSRG